MTYTVCHCNSTMHRPITVYNFSMFNEITVTVKLIFWFEGKPHMDNERYFVITAGQRSCGNVMFSAMCVCQSVCIQGGSLCDYYPWYLGAHCTGSHHLGSRTSDLDLHGPSPLPRTSDLGPPVLVMSIQFIKIWVLMPSKRHLRDMFTHILNFQIDWHFYINLYIWT